MDLSSQTVGDCQVSAGALAGHAREQEGLAEFRVARQRSFERRGW